MPSIQHLQWWLNLVNVGAGIALALSLVFGGTSLFLHWKLHKEKDEQYTREQQASDETRARLTAEADTARADNARAQADAANAHQRTQEQEQHNLTLSQAVATLQKEAAEAQRRQAEAERALGELQERLKDRHLTVEQQNRLRTLVQSPPKGAVILNWTDDPEPYHFAGEIAAVLQAAHWQASLEGVVHETPPLHGIKVSMHAAHTAPPHAAALVQALTVIGLSPVVEHDPTIPEGQVILTVGKKPER